MKVRVAIYTNIQKVAANIHKIHTFIHLICIYYIDGLALHKINVELILRKMKKSLLHSCLLQQ